METIIFRWRRSRECRGKGKMHFLEAQDEADRRNREERVQGFHWVAQVIETQVPGEGLDIEIEYDWIVGLIKIIEIREGAHLDQQQAEAKVAQLNSDWPTQGARWEAVPVRVPEGMIDDGWTYVLVDSKTGEAIG